MVLQFRAARGKSGYQVARNLATKKPSDRDGFAFTIERASPFGSGNESEITDGEIMDLGNHQQIEKPLPSANASLHGRSLLECSPRYPFC